MPPAPGLGRTALPTRFWWAAVLPFSILAILVWPRFDGLYGQDPYAYYDYAVGRLRDFLAGDGPFPGFFWPPGYPLWVALVTTVTGVTPLAGQIVSLAAGALTPVFTWLFAREVWPHDRHVPCVAALLVGCTGQLWQSSVVVMADSTGLMFGTLGMWAVARYGRAGDGRWLIAAAAAMAYALLTRWAYGLVAIPATAYALIVTRGLPRARATGLLLAATATVLAVMSPVVYAMLTAQTDPASGKPAFTGDLGVYSWSPLNAFQRQFETADGAQTYRFPNWLFYGMTPAFPYYFTPLLAWLVFLGAWRLARERTARVWCLVIGWAAVVMGFHIGAPYQNFRFSLAYLPPLAVMAAVGLVWLWRARGASGMDAWPRRALGLVVVAGWLAMMAGGAGHVWSFMVVKARDLEAVRWVESQVVPDANLLSFGVTLTFQQYSRSLRTRDLFHLTPADLTRTLIEGRPTYVLLDVESVERQWSDRPPGQNLAWLREHAALVAVGRTGPYTLLRVDRAGASSLRPSEP